MIPSPLDTEEAPFCTVLFYMAGKTDYPRSYRVWGLEIRDRSPGVCYIWPRESQANEHGGRSLPRPDGKWITKKLGSRQFLDFQSRKSYPCLVGLGSSSRPMDPQCRIQGVQYELSSMLPYFELKSGYTKAIHIFT